MKASEILENLREDAGSVKTLENRDGDGSIRFVALWRFDGGEFHRSVVSPGGFPYWQPFGEEAAKERLRKDLGSTEEARR